MQLDLSPKKVLMVQNKTVSTSPYNASMVPQPHNIIAAAETEFLYYNSLFSIYTNEQILLRTLGKHKSAWKTKQTNRKAAWTLHHIKGNEQNPSPNPTR